MASVDSVQFRLNNIWKYPQLEHVLTRKKTFGFTRDTEYIPNPSLLPVEVINATMLDGRVSQQKKFSYIKYAPSHEYKMIVLIDEAEDYADFNLSLPKYMYGNNVQMLFNSCPPPCPIDAVDQGWEGFMHAMSSLMFNLLEGEYYLDDITMSRIDICMNSLRRSQEKALAEIEQFKSNRMLYQRIDSDQFSQFKTTVMRRTRDWTFKIYFKGEEFAKHDYKKIAKNDQQKADWLQSVANQTLRCETTFRRSYLSRLYHENYSTNWLLPFRDYGTDPNKYAQLLENEQATHLPSGLSVEQTIRNLGGDIENEHRRKFNYKRAAEHIGSRLSRNLKFYLKGHTNFNAFGIAEHQALFDRNFYGVLVQKFQNHINSMTLNAQELPKGSPQCIIKYQAQSRYMTDDQMVSEGIYKKSTIINYRSELKSLLKKKTSSESILDMSAFNRILFPDSIW